MEEEESKKPHIIIDNGSGFIKALFSGEEKPRVILPTCVGDGELIGKEAVEKKGLKLKYPIEHGIIKNFDEMEKIWGHIFYNELKVDPFEHNIMLTEALLNPKENREKTAQIMFETFNVPGIYIALQPFLSIYAVGKFNGIVVELGEDLSQFVPIFDGFESNYNYNYLDIGGKDLSNYLIKLIEETGKSFSSCYRKNVAYNIKEKACYVSYDFEEEVKYYYDTYDFELPDGNHIVLEKQRILCPEALFKLDLIGKEGSISEMCYNTINKYKNDNSKIKDLYNSIILSGGCSMFNGLQERLTKEIKALAPEDMKEEVKVIASPERQFNASIGGSILSSISIFEKYWITKTEYEECGNSIVNEKLMKKNI